MNLKKYSTVCAIGMSIILFGCDSVPEANVVNCSGRGMEKSLAAFKNDEAARQAFLDKCNALAQEQ
ncbi:entry exclusion lipoprotein TrbK [Nitrosomonas marina]|uniref:Entry exclusion lipoprotein TrbK n=1 Tax=Nitrosomonas marina TaxID=917 RepID=A0A1I0AKT9_9PROT|nr:entry exclusion lipoprotein TrbK [Nitrosomonas marina]SES93926.1 entry exclusion lipoprotein TrbK [Nitrosomonas marina]